LGLLLRLYFDALMKANPFVVAITIVGVVAVSVGPFYEGLSRRDPAAIAIVAPIFLGILILLTVAIIDRRNNAPRGKNRRPNQGSRR
jgi:predicted PurR-regulated permease PerM